MITEMIMRLLSGLWVGLLNAVPEVPVPGWVMDGTGAIAEVFRGASSLGAWFPFPLVVPVLWTVTGCLVLGLSVRVGRIILSFMSGGGGSAG